MGEATADVTRVLVSSTRRPVSYVPLCKRHLQEHGEVHLSALGVAISSLVTLAEILKSRGLADEQKVATTLEVLSPDESSDRTRKKPKLEVVMAKSANFSEVMAREAAEREDGADGRGARKPRTAAAE